MEEIYRDKGKQLKLCHVLYVSSASPPLGIQQHQLHSNSCRFRQPDSLEVSNQSVLVGLTPQLRHPSQFLM
jgi:hypothetical protein